MRLVAHLCRVAKCRGAPLEHSLAGLLVPLVLRVLLAILVFPGESRVDCIRA